MRISEIKLKIILSIVFPSLISLSNASILRVRKKEDAKGAKFYALDFVGIVEERGGQAEWHNVTTEDGYILSLFRILPNSFSENKSRSGPPIYLQHGLFGTADTFVLGKREKTLAHVLSDAGYDVWAGNLRGCVYSRRHVTLLPDDPKFWDFSLDDYALKDLPAMLDYILDATNRTTLTYMGISLGTTINMILLSNRTEYNDKINLVVHLAPVAFFKTDTLLRRSLALTAYLLEPAFLHISIELAQQSEIYYHIIKYVCLRNDFMKELCLTLLEIQIGQDREQLALPWDALLEGTMYMPAGISSKILFHYGQHIISGEFQYFDHRNDDINLQYYGQTTAPDYNISNIAAPMIYYCGGNDPLSTKEDNWAFIRRLRKNITFIYRPYKTFNHIDFLVARDVKELIFDDLLKILPKFT